MSAIFSLLSFVRQFIVPDFFNEKSRNPLREGSNTNVK